MDQERIGNFIAKLRREKNITQEELAGILGVSSKTISRWENGKNMPDYSLLKPLCQEFNITINELINGEKIKKDKIIEEYDNNLVNVLKEYKRMKKVKNILIIVLIIITCFFIQGMSVLGIAYFSTIFSKIEVDTDIANYQQYIGTNAQEKYKNKWDMDESIFPTSIENDMHVLDYKMVYYDPWDAQYLSYLVVEYDKEHYQKEVSRLNNYKSTDYLGYYGVTGFSNYQLLAMNADEYQGFVYALTDGNNKIIYVELIFCNYFYDLDYENYIEKSYLPDNFDAKIDNKYQKTKLKEK